jgi:hypothetical protein
MGMRAYKSGNYDFSRATEIVVNLNPFARSMREKFFYAIVMEQQITVFQNRPVGVHRDNGSVPQ